MRRYRPVPAGRSGLGFPAVFAVLIGALATLAQGAAVFFSVGRRNGEVGRRAGMARQLSRSVFVVAVFASLLAIAPARAAASTPGTWSSTGAMGTARTSQSATLLPDGKVLVAGGGTSSGETATAELYDPASGSWSSTGSMGTPRQAHTATLLP